MIKHRTLLALSLVLALQAILGWGAPSKSTAEETDAVIPGEDDYNPQCLPLDFFEKDQSKENREKRDDTKALAAEETIAEVVEGELVAQPGYFVPAAKRRRCWGRRKNFTIGCGPPNKAYRVKNFVMASNPARVMPIKAIKQGNKHPMGPHGE